MTYGEPSFEKKDGAILVFVPVDLCFTDECREIRIELVAASDGKPESMDDGNPDEFPLSFINELFSVDEHSAHVQAQAIADRLGPFYRVSTWQDEDRVLFDALRTEKTMMFILLAFIAVVAAFCVTNTLIVITIQKTREIGLLKALGFSAGQIRSAFVLGGLVQCVAGEALGFGLGWLVLHNLQRLVAWLASLGVEVFPKSVYGLAEIPWRIVPTDVVSVLLTVFAFCFAASFLPAWLAARLDPVKAINQE